ncbi:hypothetical protein IEO21_07300 [Rhodonia placenta]|uniref:Uncharacterized protein n=1 Tax=Rhodonia placenta TaxID=104341 RepID=A0A8H7NYD4_9APHY|nr:hypothetical protein IEO21_07300 [Postia placenta]
MWTGPLAMAPNAITYQQEQICPPLPVLISVPPTDHRGFLPLRFNANIYNSLFILCCIRKYSDELHRVGRSEFSSHVLILNGFHRIAVGMIVMYIAEGVLRGLYGDMIEWIYQAARQTSTEIPGVGCIISYNLSFPFLSKLANIARTRLSVAGMLLRDGSMYFVYVSILQVA